METRKPPSLPRVLLVEDDTISQAYFRAVLEALPAAVDAVTTQACALARAETVRHDLWLVDLNLPDGSGPDLLQQLRARWPQPPPALAHTADADPAVRVAALQAGFRDVLVKPLATAELAGAVRSALADAGDLPDWDNAAAAQPRPGQRPGPAPPVPRGAAGRPRRGPEQRPPRRRRRAALAPAPAPGRLRPGRCAPSRGGGGAAAPHPGVDDGAGPLRPRRPRPAALRRAKGAADGALRLPARPLSPGWPTARTSRSCG